MSVAAGAQVSGGTAGKLGKNFATTTLAINQLFLTGALIYILIPSLMRLSQSFRVA